MTDNTINPKWYTEHDGGRWILWEGLSTTIKELDEIPIPIRTIERPRPRMTIHLKDSDVQVHSFLFAGEARWDCLNRWTKVIGEQ